MSTPPIGYDRLLTPADLAIDTGVRLLNGLLLNGWTGSHNQVARLSRTADWVMLSMGYAGVSSLDGTSATTGVFLQIPPGWRPAVSTYTFIGYLYAHGVGIQRPVILRPGNELSMDPSPGAHSGVLVWRTADPDPAEPYPGTPVP